MADPPWEIHQDLPYGTMADEEMRRMGLGQLQDEGVIFLWVTGAPLVPRCGGAKAEGSLQVQGFRGPSVN